MQPFVYLILGPPSPEGRNLGNLLAEEFSIPFIHLGDLLNGQILQEGEIGGRLKIKLNKGELIPADILIDLILSAIPNGSLKGLVITGFPRTIDQLNELLVALQTDISFCLGVKILQDISNGVSPQKGEKSRTRPDEVLNYLIRNSKVTDVNLDDKPDLIVMRIKSQ